MLAKVTSQAPGLCTSLPSTRWCNSKMATEGASPMQLYPVLRGALYSSLPFELTAQGGCKDPLPHTRTAAPHTCLTLAPCTWKGI